VVSKLLVAVLAVLVFVTAGGVAVAQSADPSPASAEVEADDDACTSFFNGKKKGHGKGGRPHPARFQAMLDAAGGDPAVVLQQCGGPDAIGGKPSKGRFPQLFD
jgi:hypothetical protein